MICYNYGGRRNTIKSGTSDSRVVYKKIERKAVSADKGKKRMKIIDDDRFTKVVNTQRTLSLTP